MTQANDQPKPASAAPVEQELGLVERLERYAAQRRAHPHIGAILGDCGTAAAEIARLRAELAEMTADRDSWADQASQRLQDALDLVAAERERWQRVAAAAQAVTTGGEDKLDHFEVPSHLMAALALAMDEGPNAEFTGIGRNGATSDN